MTLNKACFSLCCGEVSTAHSMAEPFSGTLDVMTVCSRSILYLPVFDFFFFFLLVVQLQRYTTDNVWVALKKACELFKQQHSVTWKIDSPALIAALAATDQP